MFSVIIPLYNKEQHIHATVASVLNQTYTEFELIIVNDGSKDNSLSIVQSIEDERIRIIDKPNGGVSSARNAGIEAATYDVIAFLDGDDLWAPDFLLTMKNLIEDYPEASFYGCQFVKKEGNNLIVSKNIPAQRGYINDFFQDSVEWLDSLHLVYCRKKSCFDEVGYFNTQYVRGEDLDMWCRLARRYKFAFDPTMLCYYLLDTQNRACNSIPPLKKFYLEFKLSDKSYYERKFHLLVGEILLLELLTNKRYKEFFSLMLKYNIYAISIATYIIKRKLKTVFHRHV